MPFGVDACFNNNNTQTVALSGTAAKGGALASAQVTVSCVAGSATTLTDGGGNYRVTVNAALPCVITVTSAARACIRSRMQAARSTRHPRPS